MTKKRLKKKRLYMMRLILYIYKKHKFEKVNNNLFQNTCIINLSNSNVINVDFLYSKKTLFFAIIICQKQQFM